MNRATQAVVAVIIVVAIAVGVGLAISKNDKSNKTTPPPAVTTPPTSQNNNSTNNNSTQATEVEIEDMAFMPASVTVKKGATVKWTNKDEVSHTVTSDSGNELSSDNINSGGTYSHTFNTAGTFKYHCALHPNMTGTVTVTE